MSLVYGAPRGSFKMNGVTGGSGVSPEYDRGKVSAPQSHTALLAWSRANSWDSFRLFVLLTCLPTWLHTKTTKGISFITLIRPQTCAARHRFDTSFVVGHTSP
jgi:hypothetical protein